MENSWLKDDAKALFVQYQDIANIIILQCSIGMNLTWSALKIASDGGVFFEMRGLKVETAIAAAIPRFWKILGSTFI